MAARADDRATTIELAAERADVTRDHVELCRARLVVRAASLGARSTRRWTLVAGRVSFARRTVRARDGVTLLPCGARGGSALLADRLVLRQDRATLRHARLRLFGITTPALPWVELGPSTDAGGVPNLGLLPPELGVRGDVGAFLGVGAHVPLTGRVALEPHARVGSAGSGGEARIVGPDVDVRGEMAVRHRGRARAVIEGGATARRRIFALAAEAVVVEGPRAWASPTSSVRLSRVDRASGAAVVATDHASVGSTLEAWRDATRRDARWTSAAPRAAMVAGTTMGPMSVETGLDVDATASAAAVRPHADVGLGGAVGPLRLDATGRAELRDLAMLGRSSSSHGESADHGVMVGGAARIAFRRTFAGRWVHRIEPTIGLAGVPSMRQARAVERRAVEPLPGEAGMLALAGVHTSLARHGARVAELEIAGRVPVVERPERRTLHLRARTRVRELLIDATAAWLVEAGRSAEPALASVSASSAVGSRFSATFALLHASSDVEHVSVASPFDAVAQGTLSSITRRATWLGGSIRTPWLGPVS
ncbi:MAG: hypothetical protein IT379_24430, partial [Deltaproteobacteria bacterium]|nr:hypothetical protein [Deltaproteobacteria bacterium]